MGRERQVYADIFRLADLAAYVTKTYGGVDYLMNNSGVASKGDAFDEKIVEDTLKTNVSLEGSKTFKKTCDANVLSSVLWNFGCMMSFFVLTFTKPILM